MKISGKLLLILSFLIPAPAMAAQFTCSIQNVFRLGENGNFVTHGRAALYQNRKFFLDPGTGKITGTTALHARLSNYDGHDSPIIMRKNGFRAITLFRDKNSYALIQIDDAKKDDGERPFFYYTPLDMMLTGTCKKD